jgi:hypothetical protein
MSTGQQRRVEGTERLQARYPWVDIVDLYIFLLGFDA